jgi:nicotinate-nucleotide pyrophosphorylase (carboxylating)
MQFDKAEAEACRDLILLGLREDLGQEGDITTQATIPEPRSGRSVLRARQAGTISGLAAVALVFAELDPEIQTEPMVHDTDAVIPGAALARLQGSCRSMLTGERTALNFLERLSGIATLTRKYVDAVQGTHSRIFDTRKTTPGWRLLEKYAVRCGGGYNHRAGLYDAYLIKDNHLAILGADAVRQTIRAVRQHGIPGRTIILEVDSLTQLSAALDGRPDVILLDNFPIESLRQAVRQRDAIAPRVLLEASGGITLATVRDVAQTGVERISIGALTHSAPALDIGLDYEAA